MPDELDDGPLDPLIGQYLANSLDGQLGRAAANFRAQADRIERERGGRRERTRRMIVGALALAAAASLLVGVVWMSRMRELGQKELNNKAVVQRERDSGEQQPDQTAIARAADGQPTKVEQPVLVEQSLRWRTLDEGIVMIDDRTPVRKVRRQWLERRRWFDAARGAQMETVVPREEVVFLEMAVY